MCQKPPSAVRLVTGCKVIFLCTGVLGGYLLGMAWDMLLLGLSLGGLVGYLLPTMWLRMKIKSNQRSLNHGLADALDLAGLGPAPEVFQAHYWEIKGAPAGFRVFGRHAAPTPAKHTKRCW